MGMIVGTKLDLVEVGAKRQVQTVEGEELAERLGTCFLETSAKTGSGVDNAFRILCENILKRLEDGNIGFSDELEAIKLGPRSKRSASVFSIKDQVVKRKNSCCF